MPFRGLRKKPVQNAKCIRFSDAAENFCNPKFLLNADLLASPEELEHGPPSTLSFAKRIFLSGDIVNESNKESNACAVMETSRGFRKRNG